MDSTSSTSQPATAPAREVGPRFLNRDLSWLEFNRRVLWQAMDDRVPLLERVRFLAIFTSNLDEFFMKRVGLLRRQVERGIAAVTPDGLTPMEILAQIRARVLELQADQARCFEGDILPALAAQGVEVVRYSDLDAASRRAVDNWFQAHVFPILTPLAVDPGHRFPFISNLSENLGLVVAAPGEEDWHFARVKIPDVLPRFVTVPPGATGVASPTSPVRHVALEDIIRHNLDDLFPGMEVREVLPFRVTRNAAIENEDVEDQDVLKSVEKELKQRRFARAVRLEVPDQPPGEALAFIVPALRLTPADVYARRGPLEYADLFEIADQPRPDLREPRWTPAIPARLVDPSGDIFSVIRERDILLHHPYESFTSSVEHFIAAAARDPDVLAIKQTIYRTSRDSPFVASLVRAAEEGKNVACLVELRARFDESKNVRFAGLLEKAGVHVAYGVVGLKTHCKISLVVRREGRGLRSYAHIGTGNYNPGTAQLYTDLGLLTADPLITEDIVNLFNFLTGRSLKREYNELLVAPHRLRERIMEKIDREIASARAGRPARIVAKINSLEDAATTEKLYEASAAGVSIDLIVRGFCCLRAGVPGLSENIRVISVVGRFLEHSRVFHFAAGQADPVQGEWYIGSADWMYRNLNARVEALCPVRDEAARRRLARLIEIMLADHRCAWTLQPDGRYQRLEAPPEAPQDSPEALGTFRTLMRETLAGR